ncbi:MAG: hypothetical protein ABFD79_01665 [Phycisphaerales bacterium]
MKRFVLLGILSAVVFSFEVLGQDEKKENEAGKGPTVYLCCKETNNKTNPLNEFMYFVPLISPVDVTNQKSPDNQQIGYITSCQKQTKGNAFKTSCQFRMEGQGNNMNDFDKKGMIARNEKFVKKGKPIKNILDYIKFNGEGWGRIDIEGNDENGQKKAKKVIVHFNEKGVKSPVYVGLYSVKPKDGIYLYENKFDQKVARVNTLTFVDSGDKVPKMDIKVDAVGKEEGNMGILGGLVAAIANLIIEPLEINPKGNDEMLRLGVALFENQPTFTFEKADNLIQK